MTSSSLSKKLAAQVLIRPVQLEDCDDLLEWRNDPITRANSLNTNIVEYAQHKKWFDSVLSDPSQFLMLGVVTNVSLPAGQSKIGMVRFNVVTVKNDDTKIRIENTCSDLPESFEKAIASINLNPELRGKGLSAPLLCSAIASFKREIRLASAYPSLSFIEAIIKELNIASIKCFEKAGFKDVNTATSQLPKDTGRGAQRIFQLSLL